MASETTFQLDISEAGKQILQEMAADIVEQSGNAILQRANSMASSISANPGGFNITSKVGVIKKGKRAITTITVNDTGDPHQEYIGRLALTKAIDAGRV